MKTATFYKINTVTKWLNEGEEFTPTPSQKLLHSIYGTFEKIEITEKQYLFTVNYNRLPELNTLWLAKSRELGINPLDAILEH